MRGAAQCQHMTPVSSTDDDRRSGRERRHVTIAAYLYGALHPRRRAGRRDRDRIYPVIDWHRPRVLAVALAILGLCVTDGVLTIVLLQAGAVEINPVMRLFLPNSLGAFAAAKLSLTAAGMMVLVAASQMRLLRFIPGEIILYAVLAAYVVLVHYEISLLDLA
jgi:hypothetical protein